MKDKHSRFFEMDDTLRLIFAFYSFMSSNPNWILESKHSKQNRKLMKELLGMEEADYYFLLQERFYSFTIDRMSDDIIDCKMEEYDTFYDFAKGHLTMSFSYHIPSKMITNLEDVKVISEGKGQQKKKVA